MLFPAIWVEMPENKMNKMTNTQWREDCDATMAFGQVQMRSWMVFSVVFCIKVEANRRFES